MDYNLESYKLIVGLLRIDSLTKTQNTSKYFVQLVFTELEGYYINISYMTAIDGSHSQLNQTLVPQYDYTEVAIWQRVSRKSLMVTCIKMEIPNCAKVIKT